MTYAIKPLSCDPKKLKGLSEKLIVSHPRGKAMGGGSGWVLLTYSRRERTLVNLHQAHAR
jgi:hypothetical protein